MASTIRNHIGDGLKEVTDFTYSLEQIQAEISLELKDIVFKLSKTGELNPLHFSQKYDVKDINYANFPYEGSSYFGKRVQHLKIPRPAMTVDNSAVIYLGPSDLSLNFVKYYDFSFNEHVYKRVIKNRPYCFIDMAIDTDGLVDVYLFGLEDSEMNKVAVRAVWSDVVKVLQSNDSAGIDEEFPAPLNIQREIIKNVTNTYITYYRRLNHPTEPSTNTNIH